MKPGILRHHRPLIGVRRMGPNGDNELQEDLVGDFLIMVLGTLKSSPGQPYLTWKDAKRQIRSLVKASSVKPSGTFRQRKINRGELSLPIE